MLRNNINQWIFPAVSELAEQAATITTFILRQIVSLRNSVNVNPAGNCGNRATDAGVIMSLFVWIVNIAMTIVSVENNMSRTNFDPPSDPYGDERRCRICDHEMEYNPLIRAWECVQDHDALEKALEKVVPDVVVNKKRKRYIKLDF